MKSFGIFMAFILTLALSSIFSGWAFSILWGWFIVGIFNLPALSVAQAIGFSIVVTYLTHVIRKEDINNDDWQEKLKYGVSIAIAKPLCALFIGWIVKSFI